MSLKLKEARDLIVENLNPCGADITILKDINKMERKLIWGRKHIIELEKSFNEKFVGKKLINIDIIGFPAEYKNGKVFNGAEEMEAYLTFEDDSEIKFEAVSYDYGHLKLGIDLEV